MTPVVLNGVSRNVTMGQLFELHVALGTEEARRAAFSPRDPRSFGTCTIHESIVSQSLCLIILPIAKL